MLKIFRVRNFTYRKSSGAESDTTVSTANRLYTNDILIGIMISKTVHENPPFNEVILYKVQKLRQAKWRVFCGQKTVKYYFMNGSL